jgi:two-component system, cell cycle sensor histidine kinase and response regulator CckA
MAPILRSAAGGADSLSSKRPLRLLIVDDTPADAELILACLKRAGYTSCFDIVKSPAPFREKLSHVDYDLVISDHNLGSWTGLDALEILRQTGKVIPFIVVTGILGDEAAVEYIKRGASDYVLKHRLELLPIAVGQTLREKAHRDEDARLHARIRAGMKEWELTFDSVPDAVLVIDDQCRIQRANRATREIFGLPLSKLIGRPCYEVLHGVSQAPKSCSHELLRTTGTNQRTDFEETRLGKTFDATTTPLRDASGAILGCIHVLRDISDRKQAEQALRHSVERYRSLVMATEQVVWTTDRAGAVVEDVPAWREFTGKSEEETSGQGWLGSIHADDREQFAEAWADAVKKSSPYTAEFKARRKDGEYRDLMVRGVPVLESDGVVREWVGTCTDVTDQRQFEERCRQAHKMEAMGKLAGGISHDFNNILGVIIGYSDLLLASLAPHDPSAYKVEQIKKSAHRAASLTRQMLAFSRKQVLIPKVLDLNIAVSETSKMLIRLLGEDIELVIQLNPTLDQVKVDPTQLQQVIMNLAINASDAMPNGGKLIIETSNIEVDHQPGQERNIGMRPGRYILLTVSDTGIGMEKKTMDRIFEPFFTTKDVGKGTGLGLATVYGIVTQSGGYISAHSEVGKGSTFEVYMPQAKEVSNQVQTEITASPPAGSGRVLLVEDEDDLRELSRHLLENMGYTVIEASNAANAMRIAALTRDPIELLVTDVVMPGMSGRELAELLLETRTQMKVLYVSGHADDVIVHHAILKPGVAFLQKPFTRDALAKKIQEVLGLSADKATKYREAHR